MTWAPRATRALAASNPSPVLAPVTSARRPARDGARGVSSVVHHGSFRGAPARKQRRFVPPAPQCASPSHALTTRAHKMRPSADRLTEFVTVIREGSISRRPCVDVPRTTLSRRINGLERELGFVCCSASLGPCASPQPARSSSAERAESSRTRVRRGRPCACTTGYPGASCVFRCRPARLRSTRTSWSSSRPIPRSRWWSPCARSCHVDLQAEGVDVAIRVGEVRRESMIVRDLGLPHVGGSDTCLPRRRPTRLRGSRGTCMHHHVRR